MAAVVVGVLMLVCCLYSQIYASPITALCYICNCGDGLLSCANQQADSIVYYMLRAEYRENFQEVDFSRSFGVENLSPAVVHSVFPNLKTIKLGEIITCWSTDLFSVQQKCLCKFEHVTLDVTV